MSDFDALRARLIAAAPWYDDADPDYAEFDAILTEAFEQYRATVERLRPVLEAAVAWHEDWDAPDGYHEQRLHDAVDALAGEAGT